MLRNTLKSFGSITKWLHWLAFILVTAKFYLIWFHEGFPKGSPEKMLYMMLHKSVGITILMLGILFVIWHIINVKPLSPKSQPHWQYIIAKIVHHALLTLLILMPIVGYLLTCSYAKPVNFFGLFTIPCMISKNEHLGNILDFTHETLGYLILVLVGIHILAALYHHFIVKDNVLKRMLPFT